MLQRRNQRVNKRHRQGISGLRCEVKEFRKCRRVASGKSVRCTIRLEFLQCLSIGGLPSPAKYGASRQDEPSPQLRSMIASRSIQHGVSMPAVDPQTVIEHDDDHNDDGDHDDQDD